MVIANQIPYEVKPTPLAHPRHQHFVVLGGGLAGLITAYELVHRGYPVTVVEQGATVGGLARTFEQDGFRFDIGGHRFHSNNPSVVQWLQHLLTTDLQVVPRISHIYMNQRFVDYPIQLPKALSIFPPHQAVQMVLSYLAARMMERHRPDRSFEDWVVKRYGRALYEIFFEPYTEKVWGIPCRELSATWAAQRIGIPSLLNMVKQAIAPDRETPATAISQFYYPRQGFGMIPAALEREILRRGGAIQTQTVPLSCVPVPTGFEVTVQHSDGAQSTLQADQVISTIPLNHLLQTLPDDGEKQAALENCRLDYRDMICLFVALNRRQVSQDSWTYFPLKHLTFGRTHEPKNWSPEMVPSDDYTSLAIEMFASRGEPIWEMSDADLVAQVAAQMEQIGWFQRHEIHKSWVMRVPYAYPVYHVGYQDHLSRVKQYLSQWDNLHLVGRTGAFHYMNSDGVIEDVFRLMATLFPSHASQVTPLSVHTGRWM